LKNDYPHIVYMRCSCRNI